MIILLRKLIKTHTPGHLLSERADARVFCFLLSVVGAGIAVFHAKAGFVKNIVKH